MTGTTASAQETIKRLFRALKAERQQREALESERDAHWAGARRVDAHRAEPVAVIGMACRFPGGANSPDAFWQLLAGGGDAISTVPPDRWDAASFLDPNRPPSGTSDKATPDNGTPHDDTPHDDTPGTMTTAQGGFLDVQLGLFDYPFFRLSPKEARALDPQQRLLLEVSWEALESAGLVPATLKRSRTGVYIGISGDDFTLAHRHSEDLARIDAYSITGSTPSTAAGRIAYFLGLEGPAIPVDTACSSSLVAFHLACQSLRDGETDLNLVGGVNLILSPATHVCFSRLQAISPDGRCKSFDASANGYGRGEGCGMVVLKRLSDALRDNDPILAVVKATAVNQDGASNGFTAPNGAAQKRLLREAMDKAGLMPADIQYVETHGTGTPLGDPIEADALDEALCRDRDPLRPLILGAVKSNIGHLEAAAGMAGVIKVLLSLRHGRIPPNLHFTNPNPLIPWDSASFVVPTDPVAWPRGTEARHAGISSFGFSGTNAHVILGEPPERAAMAPVAGPYLLCLSAKTPAALRETARRFRDYLSNLQAGIAMQDVCATALRHRTHFAHRLAVIGADAAALASALDAQDQAATGWSLLDQAAEYYRQGGDPDLDTLAPSDGYCRADLPTTAFDGRPCHVGEPGDTLIPASLSMAAIAPQPHPFHPLLSQMWRSPLLRETLWQTTIGLGSHPLFGDHRLFGRPVVPAAAYLSLLLAAAAHAMPGQAIDLEDIAFPAALVLPDDGTVTLHLRLRPLDDGRIEMRLVRLTDAGMVTHATATLCLAEGTPSSPEPAADHWQAWTTAIGDTALSADDLFVIQGDRLTLGPAFRRVAAVKRSGNEALADLTIVDGIDDAIWAPSFHPGLIDAALQLLPALWGGTKEEALVPVHIDRLSFPGIPATRPRWAAAMVASGDVGNAPTGDARLLDENGRVQLTLRGIRGHPMSAEALRRAAGLDTAAPCYRTIWHPLPADPHALAGTGKRWIVLVPADPKAAAFPRATFPGAVHLAGDIDDSRLMAAIADAGTELSGIVDLRSLEGGEDLALAAPVLRVAQTLARLDAPPRLWIVTRNAQAIQPGDDADPFQAALWGLGRSLALEQPRLWGGLVDLPANPEANIWDQLPAALVPGERALREGETLVPRLEPVHVPALPDLASSPIRAGVTYLVTGGWGALGLELAEWLCEKGADHLALLGRGQPISERQARLDALIAKGARIHLLQADAAAPAELFAALDTITTTMPRLAGIFHLAGRLRDGLLQDQTVERLAEAMSAKAGGAWSLDRLTRDRPLDLMVFFSSATALLGAAGQSNYAAANAFLDALAARRRREGLAGLSIAWGPWAGTGMAADDSIAHGLDRLGFTPLTPITAFDTLSRLLPTDWSSAAVLPIDWRRYRRSLPADTVPEILHGLLPDATRSRPIPDVKDRAELAAFLARTAAEVLGAIPGTAIDEQQDLFELGLDSLMALRIRNAIEGELSVSLPATILFDHPTIAGLCDALTDLSQQATATGSPSPSATTSTATTTATGTSDNSRLSSGQQGLWFLQQLVPDSAAFHTCFTARIRSALDVTALERAFRLVLDRHPPLRARFTAPDGIPRQDPIAADDFAITVTAAADQDDDSLLAAVDAAYHRPFRLDAGPPIRVEVWQKAGDDHVLLITVHHISIDVWSFELLLTEVKTAYAALIREEAVPLSPPTHGYGDFVNWQQNLLAGERGRALRDYWRDRLAGAPSAGTPPLAVTVRRQSVLSGRSFHFDLDREQTAALERMSQENGATLNMTLLAAWLLLVGRLSGRDDVIVGTPALGRSERAWAGALGFFVNVVPIRASLADNPVWSDFLRVIRRTVLDAIAHQDLPFADIAALAPQTDRDGLHPLFTTLFHLRNLEEMGPFGNAFIPGKSTRIPFGPLEIEPFFLDQQEGQYPLTMEWFKSDGALHGVLKYDTAHYDEAAAAVVVDHYRAALADLLLRSTSRVRSVDILTADDRAALAVWHRTEQTIIGDCIHQRFAAQARRTPDAIALTAGAQHVTYGALDRRANALAHHLVLRGVAPGRLVGLCLERSVAMVVGLLAVLKAGGAYVPLSPDDPAERLVRLAEDAGLTALLVQPDRLDRFSAVDPGRIVVIDDRTDNGIINDDDMAEAPAVAVTPDDLMYVLFTSGTTGTPKGVMVAHDSVANCLDWCQGTTPLTASDAMLAKTPITFDPSVCEIFWPLTVGARLVLAKADGHKDPAHLVELIAREEITTAFTVPSQWQVYLDEPGIAACISLRWVVCGGEPLPAALIRRFRHTLPAATLVNAYGPTEATVFVSTWTCPDDPADDDAVLIGAPIANSLLYVLDDNLCPLPVGVPGMLYLGGRCLARGYLGRQDLTDQAFIPDPFASTDGARMYRTGDQARMVRSAEGGLALQFLGRADQQVKLRGMRLETGEIEAVLQQHPAIAQAVVRLITTPSSEPLLAGCLVPATTGGPAAGKSAAGELAEREAAAFLERRLPGWMVPRLWVTLPVLPLTAHEKIDNGAIDRHLRAALDRRMAEPDAIQGPTAKEGHLNLMPSRHRATAKAEQVVGGIWCDLLNLPSVGRDDHFFDLGGTSLMLARVRRRLEEAGFGAVSMPDLFRHPTVASLAACLSGTAAEVPPATAPAQERMRMGSHEIAVIGMAARLPGAADIDAFWDNLTRGVESIRRFSREELLAAGVSPALVDDPAYVPANGMLEGVEYFDAGFFGYSPREAETLDPQQRLFLETIWHALEHGGYGRRGLSARVGVYAGSEISNYLLFNLAPQLDPTDMNGGYALSLANDKDFLATRASYALDLRGPGITVQTACSTSLSAVAMACDALVSGQCDMALAGGVSIQLPQIQGYRHRDGMVASIDGHCRPFDAEASGTVNGNGVGVVLLKPLARALADGDTIHAVLTGWAINNDGSHKLGYTAPNADAQARVLAEAWAHAGIEPAKLGYIEAHGTGTPLGDPIEVTGLIQAWGDRSRPPTPCLLGSVKGNIGHLGAASGVAGLIKAVLTVREARIPPNAHLGIPNPKIPFTGSPFAVNTALRDWPAGPGLRRAGISSFGIGGTNVHVVVEQAPDRLVSTDARTDIGDWQILPLSAGSADGLDAAIRAMTAQLENPKAPPLADIAFTLQEGRTAFNHRAAVVVRTIGEAPAALARAERSQVTSAGASRRSVEDLPKVAFLFPGQGAQHPDMMVGLYRAWPAFRQEIDRGLALLASVDGAPAAQLRAMLHPVPDRRAEAAAFLAQTRYTQPFLFIVEHALARLWQTFGLDPQAMMGHSVGEYVAACLAGVFTYDDALRLVAARGRLMQGLPAGSMLAVNLPAAEVSALLSSTVCLAGDNGPAQCVLSGPTDAIAEVNRQLVARGVTTHVLATSHAFHSTMMDPILADFRQVVAGVERRAPQVPVISCLTGDWLTDAEACDPDYWVRQLRGTVRFRQGVETLLADSRRILLEVGPGQTLSAQSRRIAGPRAAGSDGPLILASARRETEKRDDQECLLSALAALWTAGVDLSWRPAGTKAQGHRVPLPLYPFDRQRYWVAAPQSGQPPRAAASTRGEAAREEATETEPKRAELPRRFYTPRWTPTALPPSPPSTVDDGLCLIFADDTGMSEHLAERLRIRGERVVIIRPDTDNTADPGAGRFTLPHRVDAYTDLLETVRGQGPLRRIIHAWSLGAEAEQIHIHGLESLLFLAQSLAADQEPLDLTIVAGGVQEIAGDEMAPAHAALLLGPGMVIPREYPWVTCRIIDIAATTATLSAATLMADRVLREIHDPRGDRLVAYRRNRRWTRDFQPITIEDSGASLLRRQGVYLITGGLGGIGLEIARFLGQRYQARLILCARTALLPGDPRHETLREIANCGASVTVVTADVTDTSTMAKLVARILADHGVLHGVIHAAGIADHRAIATKTPAGMAQVLAPKVAGTLALAEAVAEIPLDFLALFSSSSAVLGAAGLMDYAAANAFLDAFAHRRTAAGLPTIAIGWDAWADTGLSRSAFPGGVSRKQAAQALSVAEGIDAFHRIMTQSGLPHIVVSPTDLNAMLGDIAAIGRDGPVQASATQTYERPELATSFIAPNTPTQRRVAELWQEILGIRAVGVQDNFFDLGGDSLVGAKLVARLNRDFGASLPAVILYETPTVETLAQRLETADPRPSAPLATAAWNDGPPSSLVNRSKESRRSRRDRKQDDFIS